MESESDDGSCRTLYSTREREKTLENLCVHLGKTEISIYWQ